MEYTPRDLEDRLVKYDVEAAALGPEWATKQGLADSTDDRKNDYLATLTDQAAGGSKFVAHHKEGQNRRKRKRNTMRA